jgi:transcription elongation factor Elf1
MKDNKLTPCPFCNGNKVKIIQEDDCYYAQCNCGICTVVCDTEEAVKLIWNTRE